MKDNNDRKTFTVKNCISVVEESIDHSKRVINRMKVENPTGDTKYLEHGIDTMNLILKVFKDNIKQKIKRERCKEHIFVQASTSPLKICKLDQGHKGDHKHW